jgi:hypothetical protein
MERAIKLALEIGALRAWGTWWCGKPARCAKYANESEPY